MESPKNLRPPVVALLAPVQGAAVPSGPLVKEEQGALFLTYRQARDAGGLAGWVEWSADLSVWEASGIAEVVIRDMPGEAYGVVAAVIPAGGTGTRFARLNMQR
ncbi:MAG: hypothetical protein V4675_00135 [Verrucomicrobiota bacterium]